MSEEEEIEEEEEDEVIEYNPNAPSSEEEVKAEVKDKIESLRDKRRPKQSRKTEEEQSNEDIQQPQNLTIDYSKYAEYLKEKGIKAPLLLVGVGDNGNLKFVSAIPSQKLSLTQAEEMVNQVQKQIEETINQIKSNISV